MEEKKYLNEEKYQKAKKKMITISLIIFLVGLVLGGGLIAVGAVKMHRDEGLIKTNNTTAETTETSGDSDTTSVRTKEEVQADIDSLEEQIDAAELEIQRLRNEQQKIFTEDKSFSDRYYAKGEEITKKEQELEKLEDQKIKYEEEYAKLESSDQFNEFKSQAESTFGDNYDDGIVGTANSIFKKAKYAPYFVVGAMIILFNTFVAIGVYVFAMKREIMAFTTQQAMPIVKEGAEEMAPVAGNVAKEISKGIKQGLDDDE